MPKKIGRNDPCPCRSGKKYKFCCLRKAKRTKTWLQIKDALAVKKTDPVWKMRQDVPVEVGKESPAESEA